MPPRILPALLLAAGAVVAACGLLTPKTETSAIADVSPVLTCVGDLVDAGKIGNFSTLEDAVEPCVSAGTDIYATASAIAQTAALPPDAGVATLPPSVASKVLALPRRARPSKSHDAGKAG